MGIWTLWRIVFLGHNFVRLEANKSDVVVIGKDTDLLVLLCAHAKIDANNIFFTSDTKASQKVKKILDIKEHMKVNGSDVCKLILFVHAFTGCYTTSRMYEIGKGSVLKKVKTDATFRHQCSVCLMNSLHEDSAYAGEALIASVYGGMPDQGLDHLRFLKFFNKVQTRKTAVIVIEYIFKCIRGWEETFPKLNGAGLKSIINSFQ